MEQKKEFRFIEQLRAERNIIEGKDLKEAVGFIEDTIISQNSFSACLRLLCLLSLTHDGLPVKEYRNFVKLFLQSYGHEHIVTLFTLKRLGLFCEQQTQETIFSPGSSSSFSNKASAALMSSKMLSVFPSRSAFKSLVKRMNLIPPASTEGSYDLKNPSDAGFVFGGSYLPIVTRLLELLVFGSEPNPEDILKLLPGDRLLTHRIRDRDLSGKQPIVILVLFLGGVTFAEVSALRFLAKKKQFKVVIATTNVINGNQLIKQAEK